MILQPVFKRRDFTDPEAQPEAKILVGSYSWHAIGGPERAELPASGDPRALWELLEWLRAPVEIVDERDESVWWGYVAEAKVSIGAIQCGVSVDGMYNRIAVAYSNVTPGAETAGTRATTVWAQDDDSVSIYGKRELLGTLADALQAVAEGKRDALLEAFKWPAPTLKVASGQGNLSASLLCRGWWETLGWVYYDQAAGLEQHTTTGAQETVGTSAQQRLGQSFSLVADTSWNAYAVHVYARKVGSPTDAFKVAVHANDGSAPGSELCSGTVDAANLGASFQEVAVTLSPGTVTLEYGTTYWIVISRTGSLSGSNYYQVTIDDAAGYDRGALYVYNGATWTARSPAADLTFQVTGTWETTRQLEELVGAAGQFLIGVDVIDASGNRSSPYRSGDTTALQVAQELLEAGVEGGRRLLVEVTRDRRLRIYEEPEFDEYWTEVLVDGNGTPSDRWGNENVAHTCPVGKWALLRDVIPGTLDVSRMADPSRFFIERATYNAKTGIWTPEARGVPSAWDIMRVQDG